PQAGIVVAPEEALEAVPEERHAYVTALDEVYVQTQRGELLGDVSKPALPRAPHQHHVLGGTHDLLRYLVRGAGSDFRRAPRCSQRPYKHQILLECRIRVQALRVIYRAGERIRRQPEGRPIAVAGVAVQDGEVALDQVDLVAPVKQNVDHVTVGPLEIVTGAIVMPDDVEVVMGAALSPVTGTVTFTSLSAAGGPVTLREGEAGHCEHERHGKTRDL